MRADENSGYFSWRDVSGSFERPSPSPHLLLPYRTRVIVASSCDLIDFPFRFYFFSFTLSISFTLYRPVTTILPVESTMRKPHDPGTMFQIGRSSFSDISSDPFVFCLRSQSHVDQFYTPLMMMMMMMMIMMMIMMMMMMMMMMNARLVF